MRANRKLCGLLTPSATVAAGMCAGMTSFACLSMNLSSTSRNGVSAVIDVPRAAFLSPTGSTPSVMRPRSLTALVRAWSNVRSAPYRPSTRSRFLRLALR